MNYMVMDMIKVLEHGYSLGTSTDYSVDGTTLIDANTGAIIPLYPEIRGDLAISGNKVILKNTDFLDGQPNTVALSGMFPDIHSHTNGFIPEESFLHRDNETGSIYPPTGDFGGSHSAPPSAADQSSVTNRMNRGNNTDVRSVVVSPTHIHLYNGTSRQNIKAPQSFFK